VEDPSRRGRLRPARFGGTASDGNSEGGSIPIRRRALHWLQVVDVLDSDGGEPRRNRTYNPQIKSLLLCQLS
jgi:hypothetical protein